MFEETTQATAAQEDEEQQNHKSEPDEISGHSDARVPVPSELSQVDEP